MLHTGASETTPTFEPSATRMRRPARRTMSRLISASGMLTLVTPVGHTTPVHPMNAVSTCSCSSRSVAAVESGPGMVVSSDVGRPVALPISVIATATAIHATKTTTAWRGEKPPMR